MSPEIDTYIEPFAGSFNCGFNLIVDGYTGRAVLNDLDRELIIFWECVKDDADKLFNLIQTSYEKWIDNPDILISLKNGSKYEIATYEYLYCVSHGMKGRKQIVNNKSDALYFVASQALLENVEITNLDCIDVIHRYDSERTFFMIDPPYNIPNIDNYYKIKSSEFNHTGLRDELLNTKGKWIVRYKEDDHIERLYKGFNKILVTEKNICGNNFKEIYYSNF